MLVIIGTILFALCVIAAIILCVIKCDLEARTRDKIELYEQENEKYKDYEVDVAFLGDSLTDWYDLESYYPEYTVVNRGIAGDTTFGLEDRLKVSAYDVKPKVVVLLIGINNIDTMFNNYESILKGLKENLSETKIVVVSITPTSKWLRFRNNRIIKSNDKIKALADKYNYTYVDLYSVLKDSNKNKLNDEYTEDGLHFNSKGYEVITATMMPILKKLLLK